MILKISNYLNSIPIIQSTVVNNSNRELSDIISLCAIATQVHIITVTHLYEKLYGCSPELLKLRESLNKFYRDVVVEL